MPRKLVLLALLAAALAAGAYGFMLQEDRPGFSPDGETILFYSNSIGIGTMTAEGEGKRPLIKYQDLGKIDGGAINPMYSPDGEKVAFATKNDPYGYRGDIYICEKDGSNVTRLTYLSPDIDPREGECLIRMPRKMPLFSPDGARILFTHTQDDNLYSWVYTVNVDGTGLTRLSDDNAYDVNPALSPDGKRIVYVSFKNTKPRTEYPPGFEHTDSDIYIMNADGSGKTRLTDGKTEYNHPAFSPGGDVITYVGGEDHSASAIGNLFKGNIYLMNLATGETKAVLDEPGHVRPPTFVPDNCEMNAEVFTVFEDADNGVTLYLGSGDCSFSPDGKKLVYSGSGIDAGETLIYISNTDGSGTITTSANYPTWYSPEYKNPPDEE